jgi:hypothetical protein
MLIKLASVLFLDSTCVRQIVNGKQNKCHAHQHGREGQHIEGHQAQYAIKERRQVIVFIVHFVPERNEIDVEYLEIRIPSDPVFEW